MRTNQASRHNLTKPSKTQTTPTPITNGGPPTRSPSRSCFRNRLCWDRPSHRCCVQPGPMARGIAIRQRGAHLRRRRRTLIRSRWTARNHNNRHRPVGLSVLLSGSCGAHRECFSNLNAEAGRGHKRTLAEMFRIAPKQSFAQSWRYASTTSLHAEDARKVLGPNRTTDIDHRST